MHKNLVRDKPIIVAEFTTNHMGNLNVLLEMVRQAHWAGASIIKMQKKNVLEFYSEEKLNSPYPSPYGHTYRDYRQIFEFGARDFTVFDKFCRTLGIPWYATAQDEASMGFLADYDIPMVKVASCNARNHELLESIKRMYNVDVPVVVSIAGSDLLEIDMIVETFNDRDVYIQQCTASYPCPHDQLFLGNIPALKERYKDNPRVKIGYSGHEIGWAPTLLAAQMGADIIERHFCLSRHSFVHHIECSLEPQEFKDMVDAIRALPDMTSSHFGMQEVEKRFLVDGKYGVDDLDRTGSHM